jgi:cell wall-associated NlpC family hydrolase
VVTLDVSRVGLLKDVFWDMNQINYHVDTADQASSSSASSTASGTGSSDSSQATAQRVLTITVTSKTADQQANDYGFTADQKNMVDQLLSSDCRQLLLELLGKGGGDGLTSDQLQDMENILPESGVGSDVVKLALSHLGDPYSQILAGQDNYTDCSYLVQSCYKQVGIDLPRTAAEQAQYCVEHDLTVSKDDLELGDLVFWCFEENGRFMNITHVGIYAGNGKVIDASSSHDAFMYRDLYYPDQQVLYGNLTNIGK